MTFSLEQYVRDELRLSQERLEFTKTCNDGEYKLEKAFAQGEVFALIGVLKALEKEKVQNAS